jgi:hypothetical protein
VQELQAEINQELLETMHAMELEDWGRFGKIRQAEEKRLRDPDDVSWRLPIYPCAQASQARRFIPPGGFRVSVRRWK